MKRGGVLFINMQWNERRANEKKQQTAEIDVYKHNTSQEEIDFEYNTTFSLALKTMSLKCFRNYMNSIVKWFLFFFGDLLDNWNFINVKIQTK